MSDKITHVENVTAKGKAWLAAMERVDANLASAIADAIEAYDHERTVVAVRLLQVQPGDIVVFHFIEPLSAQEHDEFLKVMTPLSETHPDVRFLAAESVDDITVVRGPEYAEVKRCGFSWDAKGSNTACDARGIEAHDCISDAHDKSVIHACSCGASHLGAIRPKKHAEYPHPSSECRVRGCVAADLDEEEVRQDG